MRKFISTVFLLFALFFTSTLFAKVYFVNTNYTGSPANGNSWATPFKNLDGAIAIAVDGDEIWMAKGTYTARQSDNTSGYYINHAIKIYGGFAGTETSIYARNLELNKTLVQAAYNTTYDGYGYIFNLNVNKVFVIDGLDFTNFGTAISSQYDSITNGLNIQEGDRYKLTITNTDFYASLTPIQLGSAEMVVSNSTFNDVNPIGISSFSGNPLVNNIPTVTFENTVFTAQSDAPYPPSAIQCNSAFFNAINCTFNNYYQSTISFNDARDVTFKGCVFNNTKQLVSGGGSNITMLFDGCTIDGFGQGNNVINFSDNTSTLKITNTTFKNGVQSAQLAESLKSVELDNVLFQNSSFNYQIFEYINTFKIKNSTIDGITAGADYAYFIDVAGDLEVENVIFKNSSIPFAVGNQDTSTVSITNSTFQNNTISPSAYNINMMSLKGDVAITNCVISDNTYLWGSSRPNAGIIYLINGNATITGSTFENNSTNYQSGVFYILLNGGFKKSINFQNSVFNNNDNTAFTISTSFSNAGALVFESYDVDQFWTIKNCNFTKNKSNGTGAVYINTEQSEIDNCIFKQNQSLSTLQTYIDASSLHVQIYSTGTSSSKVSNCQFINNTATQNATTVVIATSNVGYAKLDQCIFQGNTSAKSASSLVFDGNTFDVYNTLFDSNISSTANFGVYNIITSVQSANFYNCTFVKNQVSGAGLFTGLYPTKIANSIFWGNGNEAPISLKSLPVLINISNSLVQGGLASGTKIYNVDPRFVDYTGGNYRLSCQSPVINKGDNTYASMFDLDGWPRIYADTVDMGAYETHVDPALANVITAPLFTVPASVCKAEVINIVNNTANIDNYTYQWNFGNGDKSTQVSPSYSYPLPGTYSIQLTASNFCGQSNTTTKQIVVKDINAPTISVVSVVCPGDQATYTTAASCQNLAWTVTGGTITSGQGTASIRVTWGDGTSGNGKITLLATGCGTSGCEVPVTVEVPIVPANFTLTGSAKVCQGSIAHYETVNKDKSPATLYTWSAKGGSVINTNKGYNLTDVDVQWNSTDVKGIVYLTTYNELLKCGKTDSFIVALRPVFKISGPAEVCALTYGYYQITPYVGSMTWQITGTGNTISYGSVSWGATEGTYKITAAPQDLSTTCSALDSFFVHVNAIPAVAGITGETEIDLKSVDTYTAQLGGSTSMSDVDFHWASPGGTIISTYLNTATISRDNYLPDNISVYVTTKKATCNSNTATLAVKQKFTYTITGTDSICIGTSSTYTANTNPNQASDYTWTSTLDATSVSGISFSPVFAIPGSQQLKLVVTSNSKTYTVYKNVYVKSSPSNIGIVGATTIDPAGLQTVVYTVKNPANASYDIAVTGGTLLNNVSNQLTIKWNGTEPFIIQVKDVFPNPACTGVPVALSVKKAIPLDNNITASKPACLNAQVTYSFKTDENTKNIFWSLNGGGSITIASNNTATIEWNQTGSHTLTITYDRFGTQTISVPITVNALPTPVVNSGTICGSISFNLSTTQNYTAYKWFADGSGTPFSTSATPAVISEGMYTVSVTDNNGCENTDSKYIKQIPLPLTKVFSSDLTSVCTDQTAGATTNMTLATFDGQNYVYQWYENNVPIAGGNASTLQVKKPLNQANYYTYKVKATLQSCTSTSDEAFVIVSACNIKGGGCSEAPVSFTVANNGLCQPFQLQIGGSTPTTELGWDFGDGTTATGVNPQKTYTSAGIFNIQLTRRCQYTRVPVKVLAQSIFKLDAPGCLGQTLAFTDLSVSIPSNKIIKWTWNFGDNTGDFNFAGTGSRNQSHTFAAEGTYTVTLTVTALNDLQQECSYMSTKTYKITAPPTADYTITAPSCTGNIYTFIDKSTFVYGRGLSKWTFSNGQISGRDTTQQTFSTGNQSAQLTVTDLYGCTNTKTTPIVVSAPFQIGTITKTSSDTLLCNGRTVTLTSPVTSSGKTYAWRKVGSSTIIGTAQTLVVTIAGSYTVTYFPDVNCSATTAPININSFSVANTMSGAKLLCANDVLTIKSNLSDADYSFVWKFNTATTLPNKTADLILNNITTANAGNYQLTVTQKTTGCFSTFPDYAIAVNNGPAKPDINTPALNVCYNASVHVYTKTTKSGNTFSWYENSTKLVSVDTVIITNPLKSDATYNVIVKNTSTGCSTSSDNLKIKVAPMIPVIISGDTATCAQSPAELRSTYDIKDFSFQWYKNNQPFPGSLPSLTFSAITLADAGKYTLNVTSTGTTNLAGCSATSNVKTIQVKPAAATPVITGANAFCAGNSVTLTSNLATGFVWNTGALTPSITVTSGGIYSVTSTNSASGCTNTTSKTVTQNPVPDLNFVPKGDYVRCGTNKITFDGLNNITYAVEKWYVDGVYFSDQKTIYPTKSGKYTLLVTTDKGCTGVSDSMNITSQECPCYVTNINDSGDGSLREAINCSNNKPGKDAIKFAITTGAAPFIIQPVIPLPPLTDSVVINGFTQSGLNIYDIVLDGSLLTNGNGIVVASNLSNTTISGIKFNNFNTAVVLSSGTFNNTIQNNRGTNNSNATIEFAYGATNNTVKNNIIDKGNSGVHFSAGSYNNLVEANTITNAVNGIAIEGGTGNYVHLNTISGSGTDGILLNTGSVGNKIVSNTIGTSQNNGIVIASKAISNSIDSNYIGVTNAGAFIPNNQNGVYISPNAAGNKITHNTITGNTLSGIYSDADSILIAGNKISKNATGINVKNASYVVSNTVQDNTLGGIYAAGIKNTISQNVLTNTNAAVKAINLHFSVTPAGNAGKLPAVFKSYRRSPAGGILIKGTSVANDTVEIFYNNNVAQQALLYAGYAKADASGNWEVEIPQGPAFDPGKTNYYVNTAKNTLNNTSELSVPFLTGCFTCICYVTNTNDSGSGSLRAIIDEANLGGCLTIKFSLTSPDTIRLATALSPLTVPVTIVGSTSGTDPMIFVKGSNTLNGLVANSDGVTINNLGFTNFKQAVILNSNYDVVQNVTIINSVRPVTIAGNNSKVLSSAINTTWADGAPKFKADTLIYVTGSGNQIGGTGTGNKITDAFVAGVVVNSGTANSVWNNAIYGGTKAILLTNGGNTSYAAPTTITSAVNGNTATIKGVAKPNDKIQIFSSSYVSEQATGFVMEVTTDASGNWTATIPASTIDVSQNNYFVATATSTTGSTSQLSQTIRVGNYVQVCYVTNTNDSGDGSLREAVNCANLAGVDPNGLAARIEFQLPATPNVISLVSSLLITNNYGVAVNARKTPVTIKAASSTFNCFNWATNNFQVKNVSFENFTNALNCTGKNALIDSNSFVNNTNAIYVNATDSITQQTVTNNYFSGGTSSINSVRGSLIVANNTFGITKAGTDAAVNGFAISAAHASTLQVAGNTFKNIVKNATATSPVIANGLIINIENAKSTVTANIITGSAASTSPAIRLFANIKSTVSGNKLNTAYDGILFDRCDSVTVAQNTFTTVTNRGFNISHSNGVKLTQNTIVGLAANNKPVDINLATANASNESKKTPAILASTYHDGQLFLIGTAEQYDDVEVFYSNSNQRDLVKYIGNTAADSTGTWIISFAIPAAGSDTLFFRAIATKAAMLSSEASVAFTPKLKICLVTTNADAGTGSLREAIDKANLNQCNLIQFAIPGSGIAMIQTTTQLPDITTPLLIIDGTSQSGYRTGSPTVDLINTAAYGFNGQNATQLDIYGMQLTNFDVAINIVNSQIADVNDNIIENFKTTGLNVQTSTFKYGTVTNNTFRGTTSGNTAMSLAGMNGITISKNTVGGFNQTGIRTSGINQKIITNTIISTDSLVSAGIVINNSSGAYIAQNTIRQAGTGITITNGNGNLLTTNTIGLNDALSKANKYKVGNYGVSVTSSNKCSVVSNTIITSQYGISIANSKAYTLYSNTANKARSAGIYLNNAPNGDVNNNTVDSCVVAIKAEGTSHGVSFYNNIITRSIQYGVVLNAGADSCRFTSNLIGARYFNDTTYAAGAGMLVNSSNNYIGGRRSSAGYENYIKQNKKGGIIVDGGTKNIITYNYFYNNDATKGKPTAYAIALVNSGNNNQKKPAIVSHKFITGKLHVYGTDNGASGDSIHLYLGTGGYEETSQFLGWAISAGGNWEVIIDTAVIKMAKRTTWYLVATSTDVNRNTSPLSDMYILGDCYVTSLKDIADDAYPLPNTLRMAMKCANGQGNPVGIYFNVAEGGLKEVQLKMKLLSLDNHYGVHFDGTNIPDGVVAGMNAQKLNSPAWTLAATNAASDIRNFKIVNAQNGMEILSDSIRVKDVRFDQITNAGILVSNKRNTIDGCIFDTVSVGVLPASVAVNTKITGSTFNQTATGIQAQSSDSLTISGNTFNTDVLKGVDITQITHTVISSNTFNSNQPAATSITWNNSKGIIAGNTFNAKHVLNPVLISNSGNFELKANTFRDSAGVYLQVSNSSQGLIDGNYFNVATQNSIKTNNVQHVSVIGNYVQQSISDAFNLVNSSTVFVSKNTVTNVRYTSSTDSALCINIHKGEAAAQSNNGKPEPKKLSYEVKEGSDNRIGIFVKGFAEPGDSIELFFSDSISASMNQYIVNAYTASDGTWNVKIPRQFYHRDTTTWYHVIAVAIKADSNTSKTSSVIHIPPQFTKIYVLNTYDNGPNSLRQGLLDVTNSDLYSKVIFSINLPEVRKGPYNIKIDSLYRQVYSYQGFEMDGITQRTYVNVGDDQRILVNGDKIGSHFGLDIVDSSDVCLLKNMWIINAKKGMRLSNDKNKVEKFNFINTDSSSTQHLLDTALVIEGNKNALKNIFISNYKVGTLLQSGSGETQFSESVIDSTTIGFAITDSTYKSFITKNIFTNSTQSAMIIDSAAADNKIDNNIFGKSGNPVKGNVITITGSSNQTFVNNRISYFDNDPALTGPSSAIIIQGISSGNFIYDNRIGLDSLGKSVHKANVRGVTIQSSLRGTPFGNSVVGNEINGVHQEAIYVSNSSQDLISENIIGGDSAQTMYGIDSTGISVVHCMNENVSDNLILGYSRYGIELQTSDNIQMHRNIIYSKKTNNKAININSSNTGLQVPSVTDATLVDFYNIRVRGTAIPGAQVEVYKSVKDTLQSIAYVDKVIANTDAAGTWEILVPKTSFSYATLNSFAAQNHVGIRSSELGNSFTPTPVLCQLQDNPAIKVIEPLYTPCPGPNFNITPDLDSTLHFAWKAPVWTDSVRTRSIAVLDTTMNLSLTVKDDYGCKLVRTTDVIFKAKPTSPNFIISSNVYAKDTIVLVDISSPAPDSYTWYSSPGVTVLRSSDTTTKTFVGEDGNVYPKGTRFIQFILPDSGEYSIRETSIKDGCFVQQTKQLNALPKDPNATSPYFAAPRIESMYAYPNPAPVGGDVQVHVETATKDPVTLVLYSETGGTIGTTHLSGSLTYDITLLGKGSNALFLNNLAAGEYLIKLITTKNQDIVFKLIIATASTTP